MGRLRLNRRWLVIPLFASVFVTASYCQEQAAEIPRHKGILRLIPTYQVYELHKEYEPITTAQKFKIARKVSTKPGSILLAAILAGRSQWVNSTPEFGQGVKGYARYFGTGYADTVMGNYLSGAIFPSLLHQDPRYFRNGSGSKWGRIGYAIGRVFLARADDSGRWQFNYSELGGNATGVAISTAYYPNSRTASDAATRLGLRLAADAGGNILKEFWPDINRRLFARKAHATGSGH